MQHWIGSFYWDPPKEAFYLPYFDHPIVWYGILFVTGFILAYFIFNPILRRFLIQTGAPTASAKQTAYHLTDRLCWFVVAGTVIGARLGAVFFYDWPYFKENPLEIFKVWHGGLASHGGTLGVVLGVFLYVKTIQKTYPQLTFLRLLDFIAIPSALVACFIRLGNFMNQEIIGTPTTLPWGVIFGHPADYSAPIARHPVQLYEAGAYLITFFILWFLWKKQKPDEKPGALVGVLLILIFSSRFIIEFWKANIDSFLHPAFLQMGQILSIPFILLGVFLLCRAKCCKCNSHQNSPLTK